MSTRPGERIPATALLGALRNIADSVRVFTLLLEQLPERERGPWRDALRAIAAEIGEEAAPRIDSHDVPA